MSTNKDTIMTNEEIDAIREQFATCDPTYGRWHTDESKLRAFAREILSRAIPEGHVVVPGWLPIESAPKDGTRFLAWQKGRQIEECWWQQDWEEWEGWQNDWDTNPDPSHWMPLPAAPANKEVN